MVMDSLWEEYEWKEMFKDIDNFVSDIKNDEVAMEFIDELDKTLYFDDSLGKQKEMRFTNFETENFDAEQNIRKEENFLILDKFEESEGDQRSLRLMSSGTVTEMTEEEQRMTPPVFPPSPGLGSDNKCPVKVDNKLTKSFACTWPHCDKRYKKSSHLKVTPKLWFLSFVGKALPLQPDFGFGVKVKVVFINLKIRNRFLKIILTFPGSLAGAHGGAAVQVPPPRLRPHLCPVSDYKYDVNCNIRGLSHSEMINVLILFKSHFEFVKVLNLIKMQNIHSHASFAKKQ